MLAEAGDALAFRSVARGAEQGGDFHGQHGQHAGHDVEDQPREQAEEQGRAESRRLQRVLRETGREPPFRGTGGGNGGKARNRRQRRCRETAGNRPSQYGGRGGDGGCRGGGCGGRLAHVRLKRGGVERRKRFGDVQVDGPLNRDAVLAGTEQHGQVGGKGPLPLRQRAEADDDGEPPAVGHDPFGGIERVLRRFAFRILDGRFGGTALRVAERDDGGDGGVGIEVGIGMVAFLRRYPEDGDGIPGALGVFDVQRERKFFGMCRNGKEKAKKNAP